MPRNLFELEIVLNNLNNSNTVLGQSVFFGCEWSFVRFVRYIWHYVYLLRLLYLFLPFLLFISFMLHLFHLAMQIRRER